MKVGSGQWGAGGADEFWAPSLKQQIAARREADRLAFGAGWTRIFYMAAAALTVVTCALWAL